MKDVSKLTLIKNESRQDSEGIQDIFENVLESISRIDHQGNYLSVNDNYAKTCGYKSEEMVGMSWKETVHKDDVAAAEQAYELMQSQGRAEVDLRGIKKDGSLFYEHIVLVKGLEKDDSAISHYCFMEDITNHILDEQNLLKTIRHDYERYHSLIKNIPGVVYRLNVKNSWKFDFISEEDEKIFGLSQNEFNRDARILFFKHTHLDDIQKIKKELKQKKLSKDNQFSIEYRMYDNLNNLHWVQNNGTCFFDNNGNLEYVDGVIVDITRTQRAESRLARREYAITELHKVVSDISLGFDQKIKGLLQIGISYFKLDIGVYGLIDGDEYVINEVIAPASAGITNLGRFKINDIYSSAVIISRSTVGLPKVSESILKETVSFKKSRCESYLGTPVKLEGKIYGTLCFSGFEPHGKDFSAAEKNFLELMANWISQQLELKNAQKKIDDNKERVQIAFENSADAIYISDLKDGKLITVNRAFEKATGFNKKQLIGKTTLELNLWVKQEDSQSFVEELKKKGQIINKSVSYRHKNGQIRHALLTSNLIWFNSQRCMMSIARDITERIFSEQGLKAKTRALKVLNDCNYGITHIEHRDALLSYICDVIVNSGGYRFSWIGIAEVDKYKTVKPITFAGYEEDYLKNKITWCDGPTGNGPAGRCIRNHTPYIVRSIEQDPNFRPWREPALARGYSSCVALPIITGEHFNGALLIYSSEAEAFNEEEVKLLSTLSNNLVHAIRNLKIKEDKLETEKELIANEEKYRMLVEDSGAVVWECSLPEFIFTYVSKAAEKILGYPLSEWKERGFWESHLHPEDREYCLNFCSRQTEKGMEHEFEYRMLAKNGDVIWVHDVVKVVMDDNNKPIKLRGLMIDITAKKEFEQALQISEERFSLAMQGASDGLWDWDLKTDKVYFSPRWLSMLGYQEDEIKGELNSLRNLLHPDDIEKTFRQVNDFQTGKIDTFSIEFRMQHKQGFYIHILSRAFGVKNDTGEIIRMVGTHTDISETTRLSRQLEYQASHDPLTSLVNRAEFERRLQRLIEEQSIQIPGHAVCYLDLDNFKIINDTCGHLAGDAMLKQLSELLSASVRSRDTLARLGGDEFAILMEHCSLKQAYSVAEKILSIVQDFKFSWDGNKFTVGVSMGLVPIVETSGSVTDILSAADNACYMAKDAGRNCIHVFSPNDDELEKRRGEMQWVARINQALEEDMFCLFYQDVVPSNPRKYNPGKKRFEILLRIKTHDDAYIMPGAFLPAAERYNLSIKIDQWVIKKTLHWLSVNKHILDITKTCAINISGHSLGYDTFLDFCLHNIERSEIPGEKICFEITETAAIANLGSAINFINELKAKGCAFALDDFGSGLSSFGYLKNLPVDYVKIDGTFVRDILADPVDFEMVKAIHRLGHIMGKKTIAEFVENKEILSMINDIGVDYAQGYGIAKPKPVDIFSK